MSDTEKLLLRAAAKAVSDARVGYNAAMKTMRKAWKEAGLCIHCGRPAEPERVKCAYHLKQTLESVRRSRDAA